MIVAMVTPSEPCFGFQHNVSGEKSLWHPSVTKGMRKDEYLRFDLRLMECGRHSGISQ